MSPKLSSPSKTAPRRGRAALLLLALLTMASPAVAAGAEPCQGVTLARFEQGLPAATRRYVVGAELAVPFAELWERARRSRPGAVAGARGPAMPDAVTVYARQDRPLLVAYRTGGCVLSVVIVKRDQLWRVLDAHAGLPA